jgi:succinate-semialdehyde dehydrogenase/glutarate-semialdehyde dehydrogenase
MPFQSVDPTTGRTLRTYAETSAADVSAALEEAHRAQRAWRESSFAQRTTVLKAAAEALRRGRDEHARLMAAEMGKPLRDGRAEADKCAWAAEFYAENADRFLAPQAVETDASRSEIVFRPLGVVLAVMPWNFPYWQVFRFAVPALAAGNAVLLKHAPNVCGCALAIEELLRGADLPRGLFRALLLEESRVAGLIADPRVAAVTLTGSCRAGRAVAAEAGRQLKKTVLELGGSDPFLVLSDADLDAAVEIGAAARLVNAGQSCIAAKRFIVPRALRGEFERRFVERMRQVRAGDPMDESTGIGPLAREDLRIQLHRQVTESVARGARCLLGGTIPPGPGFFYPPTVLTDVARGMPAADEEVFGPVAVIIPVEGDEQAIEAANDTSFGLGAAVFTADAERGRRLAVEALEAGCCFVNAAVRSDPRLPFGGIKDSGWGRELGIFGIREFVNVKTVYVK